MLATGISTSTCVDTVARCRIFFLKGKARGAIVIPRKDWFSKMRESVGCVAWLYAAISIAGAAWILQFGFDETQIMREGTMNLWALIWGSDGKLRIVTMECAGLMVGGTSREIAAHIKLQFERMQAAVLLVRARLGPELADLLCPLANGGVQILKILSMMHGTCSCANKVVPEVEILKEESGVAIFGANMWATLEDSKTTLTDYLCGNHTRGLPVAAFNRLFEDYLKLNLGTEFDDAKTASGGHARLEKSGVLLLRSMCKLVACGHGAHAKGDGLEFKNWLENNYPGQYELMVAIGRAELSKRQDWALEASAALYPMVQYVLEYLVGTLKLDANVLRDSTLQRLELRHMEAYLHVSAIMWETIFVELRALTNGKIIGLTPVELNVLYEQLWVVGTMLRGPNPLTILSQDHRPWERPDRVRGQKWHQTFDGEINMKKVPPPNPTHPRTSSTPLPCVLSHLTEPFPSSLAGFASRLPGPRRRRGVHRCFEGGLGPVWGRNSRVSHAHHGKIPGSDRRCEIKVQAFYLGARGR